MSLSEGIAVRLVFKAYATGDITSNTEPDPTVDPASSGGQVIRRVSSTLDLVKDTYESQEVRTDRQIVDYRHGIRRVTGSISGEYSPGTYWDFIEAACRGTAASAISKTNADLGTATADGPTSKFTFTTGDPVTMGYRVGDIIRFSGLSEALNNDVNFLILSFGGTTNEEVTVAPAPTTMGADSTFTVATAGQTVSVPSTGHVKRKFAIEEYFDDIDISRFFEEVRIGGVSLSLPATGLATIEFPMMGRDMAVLADSDSPFFASPTAPTSTGIFAAVNGLIRVNGTFRGVVTGITIAMTLEPTSDAVVGQNFVPEIFLGSARVTGQITAMLEDEEMINNFLDEDEIDILVYLTTTNAPGSPAAAIHLPRVKFGGATVAVTGMGAQIITLPYVALKDVSSVAGVEATTIRFVDTQAA